MIVTTVYFENNIEIDDGYGKKNPATLIHQVKADEKREIFEEFLIVDGKVFSWRITVPEDDPGYIDRVSQARIHEWKDIFKLDPEGDEF